MTQSRKDALQGLLDSVTAGDEARVSTRIRAMSSLYRDAGEYFPGYDMQKVYHGSLDAALALHNAVLPGFEVSYLGQEDIGWTVSLARLGPQARGEVSHQTTPARAWLCAILQALIAEFDAIKPPDPRR